MGTIFGAASMWKASAYYVGVGDALFSPARSGRRWRAFCLASDPERCSDSSWASYTGEQKRAGILWRGFLGCPLWEERFTHFWYTCLWAFCSPKAAMELPIRLRHDALGLSAFCADCGRNSPFVLSFPNSAYFTRFFERIQTVDRLNAMMANHKKKLSVMLAAVLFASFSVALYFTNRLDSVMNRHGLRLSEEVSYDMMHLQIQFLLGMISLAILTIIAILLYQKNFSYLYYEARLDGLTGLFGRQQFF